MGLGTVTGFGCLEVMQLGGPLAREKPPRDFSAAPGLQGIRKQPADGRAFLGNPGDFTDLNEFGFGKIDGDFYIMRVS